MFALKPSDEIPGRFLWTRWWTLLEGENTTLDFLKTLILSKIRRLRGRNSPGSNTPPFTGSSRARYEYSVAKQGLIQSCDGGIGEATAELVQQEIDVCGCVWVLKYHPSYPPLTLLFHLLRLSPL